EDPPRIARVEQDGVEAEAPDAGLPCRARAVAAESRQLGAGVAPVRRAEDRCVLDTRVDRVGVGQRRLEVPDALELPRVRRAVVPLVRAGHAPLTELVAC